MVRYGSTLFEEPGGKTVEKILILVQQKVFKISFLTFLSASEIINHKNVCKERFLWKGLNELGL
jgi:hypothetical protein